MSSFSRNYIWPKKLTLGGGSEQNDRFEPPSKNNTEN